ncbi:MAG: sn-glycerol-1-phosphate dehydrogenase [Sphaerochaetaceae bacterium]
MQQKGDFSEFSIQDLLVEGGFDCPCHTHHAVGVKQVLIEKGAIAKVPGILRDLGVSRPFLIEDTHTHQAAGKQVEDTLRQSGYGYSSYMFSQNRVEPDEHAIGQMVMAFDPSCDMVVGIGGGTLNDIGKIIAHVTGLRYMIIATAPSMDGFASNTSSMIQSGGKISLNSTCPTVIVADLDVLCAAPDNMLRAGLGDMVAKYISICEWRIAHLITGEYYCDRIAALVRRSVRKCMESAGDLGKRDPKTVGNIMEGLILSGIAMSFAGVSRPASGVEHYFSHIWDMRALEFNTRNELHGLQVSVGTALSLGIYDRIRTLVPDRQKALDYVARFDYETWKATLRQYLGSSAEVLIQKEGHEGKYSKATHKARLERIMDHWGDIQSIIQEELPLVADFCQTMETFGLPTTPGELGIPEEIARFTFKASKDIRDKYVASRLLWDLGVLEEFAEHL